MVRYSIDPENPTKLGKPRGSSLCALKGMHIRKASKYLKDI